MDLVADLQSLGFSQHEARAYVYLLQRPLSTGYEVSKGAGLPRANAYKVLESLSSKEVIQQLSTNPVRYAALPADQVLGRIRRHTEQLCADLARRLTQLERPNEVELFWNVRGVHRIREKAAAMIEGARRRVVISLWSEDLPDYAAALRAAHESGATVIANVFGPGDLGFGQVYRHEDSSKVVSGRLITLAVDYSEALIASLDEPGSGVYTQNPTLVHLVEKLIRDESYLAEIYARFERELEAAYGAHLIDLRRRLLPPELTSRLEVVLGLSPSRQRDPEAVAERGQGGAS